MPFYLYNNQLLVRSEATGSKLATAATCCCTCVDENCTGSCSVCCEQDGVTQCRTVSATLSRSPSRVTEENQSVVTFSVSNISCIPVGAQVLVGISTSRPSGSSCNAASWSSDFNTATYNQSSATRTVKADRTLDPFRVQVGNDSISEPCETFRFYLRYLTPKGVYCYLYSGYVTINASDSVGVCCLFGGSCSTTTGTCSGTSFSQYSSCSAVAGCGTNLCQIGWCCANGNCYSNVRCEQCRNFYFGTFYSTSSYCTNGVCCVGGTCYNTTRCNCDRLGGTFYSTFNFCATGACCINGICYTRNQCSCFQSGGTFYPNNSCSSSNPCATCSSVTTNFSYTAPCSTSCPGPPNGCLDLTNSIYYNIGQTLTRGASYWPSGCNCVSISGSVDDILLVNGSPVNYSSCQGASSVAYNFSTLANSFTLGVADTKGGGRAYNVNVEFHSRCGAMTASPLALTEAPRGITAADGLTADSPPPPEPEPPGYGPGTELKALLSKVGITSTPTCSCNARANHMDIQGIQWCRDNEELILAWLKEEAENRNLPFMAFGAKMLVRRAIKNAEKKAKKAADQPPPDTNG
jgi:hypothetical protein